MPSTPASRALMRCAFGLLVVAAAASVWSLLANQAPGSPLYLGMLAGPIESVRDSAAVLGLVFIAVASLLPGLAQGRVAMVLVAVACIGATLDLGAGIYAAIHGLHAIQFKDPRSDIAPLVTLKYTGQALLGLCLVEVTRRVWTRS